MTNSEAESRVQQWRAYVGRAGQPVLARDPVNSAMIRHWCDALEDDNPAYTDPAFAARSVHGAIVAPPTMLSAWTTPGSVRRLPPANDPFHRLLAELAAAGYHGVMGTGTEHEYRRYLQLGEVLVAVQSVVDVSSEKRTALGAGHFVTTATEYRTEAGESIGRIQFGLLAFKPDPRPVNTNAGDAVKTPRPLRPRPGISRDTQFFWDGLKLGELRIQRCNGCGLLQHPPMVRCPACGSYDQGYTVSCGRGIVYSFVEPCHPQVAAFDYPYVVGLVELEEGTRLITNIVDVDPATVAVGLPVELVFRKPDPDLTLPMFRPQRPPRRVTTLHSDEIAVGDELPPCPIPITTTLIVAGALASRDYTDFHHDREAAIKRGSPDIFMNILTTSGLCGRYVSDWVGPEALLRHLKIRLGVPNYPHDTMTLSAAVRAKHVEDGKDLIEVGLRGYNRLGDHVTGTVTLELPSARRGR